MRSTEAERRRIFNDNCDILDQKKIGVCPEDKLFCEFILRGPEAILDVVNDRDRSVLTAAVEAEDWPVARSIYLRYPDIFAERDYNDTPLGLALKILVENQSKKANATLVDPGPLDFITYVSGNSVDLLAIPDKKRGVAPIMDLVKIAPCFRETYIRVIRNKKKTEFEDLFLLRSPNKEESAFMKAIIHGSFDSATLFLSEVNRQIVKAQGLSDHNGLTRLRNVIGFQYTNSAFAGGDTIFSLTVRHRDIPMSFYRKLMKVAVQLSPAPLTPKPRYYSAIVKAKTWSLYSISGYKK